MAYEMDIDGCEGAVTVTVSGPAWLTEITVEVGSDATTHTNPAVADDGPWWSASSTWNLAPGEHRVIVRDANAAGEAHSSLRTITVPACPVEVPTTEAPATTVVVALPVPPDADGQPSVTLPPVTTVELGPPPTVELPGGEVVEQPVGCCADWPWDDQGPEVSTVVAAPAGWTLPETGVESQALVGVGCGLLVAGVMALWAAARRPSRHTSRGE